MKYLKKFENTSQFEDFKKSSEWITPNVSYVIETSKCNFQPYTPPITNVGDIAYWDGSKIKTIPLSSWNVSLGTPVGVVVVPEGFAPDGKVRIVSLKYVDSNGNPSDTYVQMKWGPSVETSLTNYDRVPTTDNAGVTSNGSYYYGQIPSDTFTSNQSFVDPEAYYDYAIMSSGIPYIPSPYFGDSPNPEYYKSISGYNNAFSDFNGLSNTQTLVGLGSDYVAANAAWKYKDGVSNLQWYLLAMGELGYIMARFNLINESITAVGGVGYDVLESWSSTERYDDSAWFLTSSPYNYDETPNWYKYYTNDGVRPFATI